MPYSLVLGSNGQDGSYLVDRLLGRGHNVIGVGRQVSPTYQIDDGRFQYVGLDVRDPDCLAEILASFPLDFVFHAAAVHGPAGFDYEAVSHHMMAVNVGSVVAVLEHARTRARNLRVIYANSSKIFSGPLSGTIDESSTVHGSCLYSISKITSRDLLAHYRRSFGISTTNLILFNHESSRRRPDYVFPKFVDALASAVAGSSEKSTIRTLDFKVDWSAADELMDITVDIALRTEVPELVLASGHTWDGRDAVEQLFSRYGLDWVRHIDVTMSQLDSGPEFHVDLDRLSKAIGRVPNKTIFHIAEDILSDNYGLRLLPSPPRV